MASKQPVVILPPPTNHLFPSPLHIRKKSRRATFYRRVIRKSPKRDRDSVYGPLDDIIAEISSDIWASPPSEWSLESTFHGLGKPLESLLDWRNPPKAASTCTVSTVTPLPVSRTPSSQPLTIRKNRSSRSESTASYSSASHIRMVFSRSSKESASVDSSKVRTSSDEPPKPTPWLQVDASSQIERSETASSNDTIYATCTPAQQALEEAQTEHKETKRRSSRARLFPAGFGFTRLLRSGSEAKGTELAIQNEFDDGGACDAAELATTQSIDEASINSKMKEVRGLPSPLGNRHEADTTQGRSSPSFPTALKTKISMLPEVKLLESDGEHD